MENSNDIKLKDKKTISLSKYNKNDFNFPDSLIAPENKGEEYHRAWGEKIYSLYVTQNAWIPSGVYNSIDENRAYADGKQSMEPIKDWILGKTARPKELNAFDADGFDVRDSETPESRRKAWGNIDFSPVSVAPKIWTKINEDIRSVYYELSVNAIDSFSVRTEEHEKYRLWFYKENQKWIESQQAAVGIQPNPPDFIPENMEELELYAATGGFKVPHSIVIEDLLKHTFEVSDWDKEVAEKIRKDLFCSGYAIIREVYDREVKRVKVKYCDIRNSGVQYSVKNSFKDSEYGYELDFVEISYVRQRLNMSHEEAAALAFSFSGQYGNPVEAEWDKYAKSTLNEGLDLLGCDFYKVPVFHFEFVDIDTDRYVEFTDKHGALRTKPYRGDIQDNEELKTSEIRYVRKGSWIVGTQHLFDYGRVEYIPRDNYKKPRISFRGVKLSNTPIIEQIKPFIKGFTLAWIKAQSAIAYAVGNGLAVDIGSIKNISIGKDKSFDPMEILSYYRQSSFLLYKKSSSLSGFNKYSAPPVTPINNDMFRNIESNFNAMNFYLQKIEESCGISMVATGKAADPYTPKYGLQLSLQGTNSIINSIVRAQTDIQEDISVNVGYRIRTLCRMNDKVRESYSQVVGERRMKIFVEAERNHVDYGYKITATNIDERKQQLIALLQASIDPSGSGETAKLSPTEALIFYDMLNQNQNIRRIGLVLGYMLRRKEKEMHEKKMMYIEKQNEGLASIEQQKQQWEQMKLQHESEMADKKFWADYILKFGMAPNMQQLSQPQQEAPVNQNALTTQ